jgi:hypothetical protein
MDMFRMAAEKRKWHLAKAAEYQRFIEIGRSLSGHTRDSSELYQKSAPVVDEAADYVAFGDEASAVIRKRGPRKAQRDGVVIQTATIVKQYMEDKGEGLKTRELLPYVVSQGMEVGGQNPIATLSARLGTSQMFTLVRGKWYIRDNTDNETADASMKDEPAASDHSNQEGGEANATTTI